MRAAAGDHPRNGHAEASAVSAAFRLTFRGQLGSALGAAQAHCGVDAGCECRRIFYIAEDNEPGGVSTATLMDQLQQRVDSGSMQQFMPEFLRYEPQPGVDTDSDGVINALDHFADASEQLDTDGDNIGDAADTDDDGDGLRIQSTRFLDASEHVDTDGDGVGNEADTDDDGDSVLDSDDQPTGRLSAAPTLRRRSGRISGAHCGEGGASHISGRGRHRIAGLPEQQEGGRVEIADGRRCREAAGDTAPTFAGRGRGRRCSQSARADAPATSVAVSTLAGAVDAVPTPPPRVLSNSSVLASGGSSLPAAAASPPPVREVAPARPDALLC